MPIKIERHLALLAKAEELSQGLTAARQIIEREVELARATGDAVAALGNIDLMARPEFLVKDLAEARALLFFERNFYSDARVKAANRQRKWRKLKKGTSGSEGDA